MAVGHAVLRASSSLAKRLDVSMRAAARRRSERSRSAGGAKSHPRCPASRAVLRVLRRVSVTACFALSEARRNASTSVALHIDAAARSRRCRDCQVPRGSHTAGWSLLELPGERVFAPAPADDQNPSSRDPPSHGISERILGALEPVSPSLSNRGLGLVAVVRGAALDVTSSLRPCHRASRRRDASRTRRRGCFA